jgi:3-deoxy-manno-octulosonate cytidylyltransferase (CMP-KDO synthetase)
MRGIIVIPARRASTRLPDKLLLAETGKPLLAHVIDRGVEATAASGGLLTRVIVACDDPDLKRVADEAGVLGVMTRVDHLCGTTRIAEAVESLDERPDFVVNVQGDEPELAPAAILKATRALLDHPEAAMSTLVVPMGQDRAELKANPAAVKCVRDGQGRALYFSRAPIPFDRAPPTADEPLWWLHLGIYAYRTPFLLEFARMPPSPLERRESLEQLRALDAGRTIMTAEVPWEQAGKGIDTPEDYRAFVLRHQRDG